MKETDLAYISGFFDADGSVYTYLYKATKNKKLYKRIVVKFYNTDLPTLEWIQSLVGGQIYTHNGSKIGKTQKQCWVLRLTEKLSKALLKEMLPYLKVKKEKVMAM